MTDQQLEYEIKDWQEGKRFKTMNNTSDQLPTLTAEEAEQIEKEAADEFPFIQTDGMDELRHNTNAEAFRLCYIAGATLYKRRSKAEREDVMANINKAIELLEKRRETMPGLGGIIMLLKQVPEIYNLAKKVIDIEKSQEP